MKGQVNKMPVGIYNTKSRISRKNAIIFGYKTYDGNPCKNCKTTLKLTCNCSCVHCNKIRRNSPSVKQYHHEYWYKWKYNITYNDFKILKENQKNKCAICGKILIKPILDHDHKTGKIRGLLCYGCNTFLGLINDNKKVLQTAIKYLGN